MEDYFVHSAGILDNSTGYDVKSLSEILFFLFFAFFITSCHHPSPPSHHCSPKQIARAVERKDIFHLFVQTHGGPYMLEPQLKKYVDRVASRLIAASNLRNRSFQFEIVNHNTPFALAFPGGQVALSRALFYILENEAQLAAILAHQAIVSTKLATHPIAHEDELIHTLTHTKSFPMEAITDILRLTPETERQIDEEVIDLMQILGYDPGEILSFHSKMAQEGYASLIPYINDRSKMIEQNLPDLEYSGYLGKKGYIETILPLLDRKEAYDFYQKALDAYQEQKYQKSLEYAEIACSHIDEEGLFHLQRGRCFWRLQKKEQALEAFSMAIKRNSLYHYPYFERGKLFETMNKLDRAKRDLEMATEYFPSAIVLYRYGELLSRMNAKQEAHIIYKKLALFNSNYGEKARKKMQRHKDI